MRTIRRGGFNLNLVLVAMVSGQVQLLADNTQRTADYLQKAPEIVGCSLIVVWSEPHQ